MKTIKAAVMLVLAFGSAAAATAHTAQMVSTQGWRTCADPDFTVVSQMSDSDTAVWADRLNQFLHAMEGRLPVDPRTLGPLTLVLFNRRSDFWDSAPVLKNGDPLQGLGGFSSSGGWGAMEAKSADDSDEEMQRSVYAAGVDWLLSGVQVRLPRALRIGLKEVYGGYVVENHREIFGQPPRGWTSRLQRAADHPLATDDRFLKVEELLEANDMNLVADRHGVSLYYVEAWGFAHFLLFSKDMAKQHAMTKLFDAFAHHATPPEALREALGDEADTINSRFAEYIRGGDFYEVARPYEAVPPIAAPAPADPAFVAAILARLEAGARNLDVARGYAEQAIQLAPADPRPREALALVDYVSDRHAEAAADCREALRLDSRDGWTWYEMADEVSRQGTGDPDLSRRDRVTPEQAREVVNDAEKAIIYCKSLKLAYDRVAGFVPGADHVTEDDGKFLVLGRTLFPDDGWIEIGHAQWARRVNNQALALAILDDVLSRSSSLTPQETARARHLRRQWTTGPS